jgi:hypothetical protein
MRAFSLLFSQARRARLGKRCFYSKFSLSRLCDFLCGPFFPFAMKKTILFCFAFSLVAATLLPAQDRGLYWKYKEYDGAVAFSVPRWTVALGSLFLDEKAERKLLRKVRRVNVLVFEDEANNPVTARDLKRFHRKAKRRNLDELLTVRSEGTHVSILGKSRGSTLRKAVVLVQSPETFVLVSVRGKLRLSDLNRVIDKYGKNKKSKKDKDNKPLVPPNVKIPVVIRA